MITKQDLIERLGNTLRKDSVDVTDCILHKILTCQQGVITDIDTVKSDLSGIIQELKLSDVIHYETDKSLTILFGNSIPIETTNFLGHSRKGVIYTDFYLLCTTERYDNEEQSVLSKFLSIYSDENKIKALQSLSNINTSYISVKTIDDLDNLMQDRDFILNFDNEYFIVHKDKVTQKASIMYTNINNPELSLDAKSISILLNIFNQ